MEKEKVEKLTICCISDIAKRLDNSRRIILEMEKGDVISIRNNQINTSNTIYIFVNCRRAENVKGILADQVIIDMREPMRSMARDILRESCVPEEYQIIDDRKLYTSDL